MSRPGGRADVDVAVCRRLGIAVAGVDEDAIGLYRYLAVEVARGLLTLAVEIVGSTVLVAGDGKGYAYVVRGLAQMGARVLVAAPESAGRIALYGGEKAGDALGDEAALGRLAEADALVLCPEAPGTRWIGRGGPSTPPASRRRRPTSPSWPWAAKSTGAPSPPPACAATSPAAAPTRRSSRCHNRSSSFTRAGLKIAEVMTRARRRGSSPLAAEQLAAAEAHAEQLPKDLGARR